MKRLLLIATLLTCSVSYGQGCSGNCYNGQDTYTWADGDIYVGDWRNGERTGQGTLTFASGAEYVGEFRDNKRTGQGTYTWANGDIYVGEFQDGKKHGQGTYTHAEGRIMSGFWENDTYFRTKAERDAKERELKAKAERERLAKEAAAEKERLIRETAQKKYNNIYNACLLDKSSGVDMQVNSLRRAVEETCESIAEDPSWLDNWKYN